MLFQDQKLSLKLSLEHPRGLSGMFRRSASLAIPHLESFAAIKLSLKLSLEYPCGEGN